MARTLFEAIGYTLGQKAAQARNDFDLVGGTEGDSLRAEIPLGREGEMDNVTASLRAHPKVLEVRLREL